MMQEPVTEERPLGDIVSDMVKKYVLKEKNWYKNLGEKLLQSKKAMGDVEDPFLSAELEEEAKWDTARVVTKNLIVHLTDPFPAYDAPLEEQDAWFERNPDFDIDEYNAVMDILRENKKFGKAIEKQKSIMEKQAKEKEKK